MGLNTVIDMINRVWWKILSFF